MILKTHSLKIEWGGQALASKHISQRDSLDQQAWEDLKSLPHHVAVRTAEGKGTQIKALYSLSSLWIEVNDVPVEGDPYPPNMLFEPMLVAGEEFDAGLFTLLHGFYRPSVGCARNALEVVTIGCACETLKRQELYTAWQNGTSSLFGRACDTLIGAQSLRQLRNHLANKFNDSLFDQKNNGSPGGWLRRLFDGLSNYAHSRPGFTSGDFWRSNGPVYDADAFGACFDLLIETFAACYLLVKIGKPTLQITPLAKETLFERPSGSWLVLASEAAKELGLI